MEIFYYGAGGYMDWIIENQRLRGEYAADMAEDYRAAMAEYESEMA